MNEELVKEKIKKILGNKYKKVGLTEEEIVDFCMKSYERISREITDEKMREAFVDITISGFEHTIKMLSWKIEQ